MANPHPALTDAVVESLTRTLSRPSGTRASTPYVHATFILSYGLVAEGARRQHALLAG